MKTYISSNSPKNKFIARITFNKASRFIGSTASTGAMTLEDVKISAESRYKDAIKSLGGATIVILENKKAYPEFEWVEVENYKVK